MCAMIATTLATLGGLGALSLVGYIYMGAFWFLLLIIAASLVARLRSALRERYGVPYPGACCDVAAASVCCFCSVCQVSRHIHGTGGTGARRSRGGAKEIVADTTGGWRLSPCCDWSATGDAPNDPWWLWDPASWPRWRREGGSGGTVPSPLYAAGPHLATAGHASFKAADLGGAPPNNVYTAPAAVPTEAAFAQPRAPFESEGDGYGYV